jgi:hypothetical protein
MNLAKREALVWCAAHKLAITGIVLTVLALATVVGVAAAMPSDAERQQALAAGAREARSANRAVQAAEESEPTPSAVASVEPGPAVSVPSPQAAAVPAAPVKPGFSVGCAKTPLIPAFSGDAVPCRVTSTGGFSSPVSLQCVNPPANLRCSVDPASITPKAGRSEQFHLSLSNEGVPVGNHQFEIVGTSNGLRETFGYPFNVKDGDLNNGGSIDYGSRANLGCSTLYGLKRGGSGTVTCNFQTSGAFKGSFTTSCEAPPGLTCSVDKPVATPIFSQGADIIVTITAAPDAAFGAHNVVVRGESPNIDDGPQPRGEIYVKVGSPEPYVNCDPGEVFPGFPPPPPHPSCF